MVTGEQCAMIDGVSWTHLWSAGSWGSQEVSFNYIIVLSLTCNKPKYL